MTHIKYSVKVLNHTRFCAENTFWEYHGSAHKIKQHFLLPPKSFHDLLSRMYFFKYFLPPEAYFFLLS